MSHTIIQAHEPHPDLDELHSRIHHRTKHIHKKRLPSVPHEEHEAFHNHVSKNTARRVHKIAPKIKEILQNQLHLYEEIVDVVTDVLIEDYLEEKFMDHPEMHPAHPDHPINQDISIANSKESKTEESNTNSDTLLSRIKNFVS